MNIYDGYVDSIDDLTDLEFFNQFDDMIQKHLIQQRFAIMVFENTNVSHAFNVKKKKFKKNLLKCVQKQLKQLEKLEKIFKKLDEILKKTAGSDLPVIIQNKYGIAFISMIQGNQELSPSLLTNPLETYLNLLCQKECFYEFISCYSSQTIHMHRKNICYLSESLIEGQLDELTTYYPKLSSLK